MSVGAQYVACPGDEVGKRGKGKGGPSIHGIGKVLLLLLIEQIVSWKGSGKTVVSSLIVSFFFFQDEDVCSNGSISSVEDHHYYFGERLGTWCCFPPPPSERSSEMERKHSMIEQRIKTLESHGRMSRSEAERTGVTAVV